MIPIEERAPFRSGAPGDIQRLKATLGPLPEPWPKPVLVLLSGLPGTGKSWLARRLGQRLPLLVLETDTLRRALFGEPRHTRAESARLFAACHHLIYELLSQGVPTLFDATNLQESHREPLYRAAQLTDAKLILVRTTAPSQTVWERLRQRRQGDDPGNRSAADWRVYQRMRLSVEPIRRNHLVADTSRDVTPVVDRVAREVNGWLRE